MKWQLKYLLLASVPLLLGYARIDAQSCLPEGITFETQAQIDSFQYNYPNCTIIEGDVFIYGFYDITNLNGLTVLTSIGGNLRIGGNLALTKLTGLKGVTSIGGYLEIGYNYALTSLKGLSNVSAIGGYLWIEMNNALTSLTGLDSIESNSIGSLTIFMNDSLSTCEVKSICDYLSAPNGSVWIIDNAVGCEDKQQVLGRCATIGVNEDNFSTNISTHPNPFTTSTTIEYELTEPTHIQLTIYNTIGETIYKAEDRLMSVGKHTFIWNAESLPEGLYYGVLRSGDGVSVVKLIKQ